jgi:NTE family protein
MQWAKLPRFAASALRGFTGMAKGAAIETTFDARFGLLTAGEFPIPLSAIVFDMDRGRVGYFGTRSKPELTIDLLPTAPILEDDGFDRVFAVNFMLPPQLEPEDITGWQTHTMGVLRASRQAEQGYHLEFARRSRAALGDRLTVIDAADHRLLRGPAFYDLFIDRSRWPELIREGYERAAAVLDTFRARRRAPRRSARRTRR